MTPFLYLMPRTEVPVVIGRVVAWLAIRALAWVDALGSAREEVPPAWRERDMVRMRVTRRDGMVEI